MFITMKSFLKKHAYTIMWTVVCVVAGVMFYKYQSVYAQTLPDPLGTDPNKPLTPQTLIGRAVRYLFGVAGSLALLNFVIAGIRMMMAQGVPDKVNAAKKSMQYTVIGLVAMFTSYAIIRFIIILLQNK